MWVEFNTEKKLAAFTAQVDSLLLSDFPHDDARTALRLVRERFDEHMERLAAAVVQGNKPIIARNCATINERIREYLPVLGFLLRSTNVRNSFESYDTLVQIAKGLIGQHAHVILSSEWDFSPLTFPMNFGFLPDFVLLGMPATESGNALVLPLFGHEIGHSLWLNEEMKKRMTPEWDDSARAHLKKNWPEFTKIFPGHPKDTPSDEFFEDDLFLIDVVSEITRLVASQLEETFCDGVGLALFGVSYVASFHYLLAPNIGNHRAIEYPPLNVRAGFMEAFGAVDVKAIGFQDFESEFQDNSPQLDLRESFILKAADAITFQLAENIYMSASALVASKIPEHLPSAEAEDEVFKMFKAEIPASNPKTLADILNAGWRYVRSERGSFDEGKRPLFEWISELMLKSIEVLEFRRKTGNAGL